MTEIKRIEWANPQQKDFVEAGPEEVLLNLGGFGSSKTYGGLLKLLYLLDQYPNSRGAIVRARFNQLQKTTLSTLWALLPPEAYTRRNDQGGFVDLRNGSRIYFIHLDSDDSLMALRGLELNFVFVDEACEISEEAWDVLDARVGRWSHASKLGGWPKNWPYRDGAGKCFPPRYLFAATNSPGFESWTYRRWCEQSPEYPFWRDRGYRCIISSSRDNKFLGEQNLDVMLSKDPEWIKRWVDGSWGEVQGQIFDVSNTSLLEGTPELVEFIKNTCRKFRTLDHGMSAETVCLWTASDREGNLYVYKEYGKGDTLISEHRRNITELSKGEIYDYSLADPSIFHKSAQKYGGKWSVAMEYSDVEILPLQTALHWQPADNSELVSRSRLQEYLAVDPEHMHPITKQKGAPRLYFVMRSREYPIGVSETLVDLRSAKRIKIADNVFSDERDPAVRDHYLDALRYMVVSRPAVARPVRVNRYDPTTFMGYSNLMKRSKKLREAGKRKNDPTLY